MGDPTTDGSLVECAQCLRGLSIEIRANSVGDLTGGLVRVETEKYWLSESKLVAMCFLLVVAGHATTVNPIGNGALDHPGRPVRLQHAPGLMKGVVEGFWRHLGPVKHSPA